MNRPEGDFPKKRSMIWKWTEQVRGLLIITVGRMLQLGGQIFVIRTFTTFLSPEEVGRNYLLISLSSWFNLVLLNPVSTYMGRNLLEWHHNGLAGKNYLKFGKYIVVVAMMAVLLLIGIQVTFGLGIEIKTPFLICLVMGSLMFGAVSGNIITALNVFSKRGFFVIFTNLMLWGGVGLSMILVSMFSAKAEYWVIGQILGQAIVIVPAFFLFWRLLSKPFQGNAPDKSVPNFTFEDIFRFSWPLSVAVGLFWLQSEGYRFVLSKTSGEATLGLFAVGYAIGAGLMIAFETLFNQFYQPIFYRALVGKDIHGRVKAWNEYASAYIPTIILVGAFVATGGPFFVDLMTGEKFQGIGGVVIFATIVESFRMVSSAYYMAALGERDMRVLIIPGALGALIALSGVYLLAPINPFLGTGFALCLGALTVMIGLTIKLRLALPIILPWNRILSAGLLVLPMWFIFLNVDRILPGSGKIHALIVLGLLGFYLLIMQFIFARKWIFQEGIL